RPRPEVRQETPGAEPGRGRERVRRGRPGLRPRRHRQGDALLPREKVGRLCRPRTMAGTAGPTKRDDMTTAAADQEQTGLGNYFIANYPPFSFWKPAYLPDAARALNSPPAPGVPLGLYLHIPF